MPIEFDDRVCSRSKILAARIKRKKRSPDDEPHILYFIIGALAVVTAALSYHFYQERQKSTGIEINVGKTGISIEKK